jgi:Fuc2NAc and GlcNAc transferase
MDWFRYFIIPAIVSYFVLIIYRKVAIHKEVVANPNFRTLHEHPIPTGGGVVFLFVFVSVVFTIWWLNKLSNNMFYVFGVGGGVAVLFGFLDDLIDLNVRIKLTIQFLLGGYVLFWFDGGPLLQIDSLHALIAIPVTLFFLIWMINAYNFMDGIDGMAASGAVFISGTILLVMLLTSSISESTIIFVLLLSSTIAFMLFNWPPASIFMGDAGSVFLGYTFGALLLFTVMSGDLSIWTWLTVFGYFVADTTVTQIARLVLVEKWWRAHRSHAYQNLARITGSHLKVTGGVTIYHFLWILPLTLWSAIVPEFALVAVFLAVTPAMGIAYKYGPVFSSS